MYHKELVAGNHFPTYLLEYYITMSFN